jgi:hypothetical protein
MLHICGVSKTFGEWYQKTNKTEDTNARKLTLLAFKIIIILHNTRLATFITLLGTDHKCERFIQVQLDVHQACQTCAPRAACGPLQAHLRPAQTIL